MWYKKGFWQVPTSRFWLNFKTARIALFPKIENSTDESKIFNVFALKWSSILLKPSDHKMTSSYNCDTKRRCSNKFCFNLFRKSYIFNQTVPLSSTYKGKNNVNEIEKDLILCRLWLFLRLKRRQMNFLAAFNHKLQFCEWGFVSKVDHRKKSSQNYELMIPDMCKNERIRGFAKWEIGTKHLILRHTILPQISWR